MKKKKRRYSRLVILDSKKDTTKEIKKILSKKHNKWVIQDRDQNRKQIGRLMNKVSKLQ